MFDAIRRATNGNYALGSERFQRQIAEMLGRRVTRGRPGRKRKALDGDHQRDDGHLCDWSYGYDPV